MIQDLQEMHLVISSVTILQELVILCNVSVCNFLMLQCIFSHFYFLEGFFIIIVIVIIIYVKI